MTQTAQLQASLALSDNATVTVVFPSDNGTIRYQIPRVPPDGLSAMRYDAKVRAFTEALSARQSRTGSSYYESVDERIAHAKWLAALASTMEAEAKMHRKLATRLVGRLH